MAVVALVCSLNQGLELGHVIGVGEVDHINCHVVLAETLAKGLVLGLLFVKRMAAEDDDSGASRLVHAMFE